MLLNPVYSDEQIMEINERAIRLFQEATEDKDLSPVVEGNVYTGILNMSGQVEAPRVSTAAQLPRRDTIKER